MAIYSGGSKKKKSKPPVEPDYDEQLRIRRELGIQGLPDGEELMNTAIFSRVQLDAALKGRKISEGPEPDAAETNADTADGELVLEEITTELPTPGASPRPSARPPAHPGEVAALEHEMMSAKDRDEVVDLALRIATYYARSAAVFVVNGGLVAGLRSAGEGLAVGIEAVMIPVDSDSVICMPAQSGKVCRKRTPLGEVDGRVLRAMGRSDVKEVLVLPVPIGERTVNLLYADNGGDSLPDTSVGALRVLALGIAKAYERLVETRDDDGA
jgi:hypothetical protein